MPRRSLPALNETKVAPHLEPPSKQIEVETAKAQAKRTKQPAGDDGASAPPATGFTKATFDVAVEQLEAVIEAAHAAGHIPRSTLVRAILQNWQGDQRTQVAVLKIVNDPASGVHRPRGTPSHHQK